MSEVSKLPKGKSLDDQLCEWHIEVDGVVVGKTRTFKYKDIHDETLNEERRSIMSSVRPEGNPYPRCVFNLVFVK